MNSRIWNRVLAAFLVLGILAGCGQEEPAEPEPKPAETTEKSTPAVTEQPVTEEEPAEYSMEEFLIDENAIPQERVIRRYNDLANYYNAISEVYFIEPDLQDEETDEAMNRLSELIDQVRGHVENDSLNDEERQELLNMMEEYTEVLDECVKRMDYNYEDSVTPDTLNAVRENYSTMISLYNSLCDYYNQPGMVMSSDEVKAMKTARQYADSFDEVDFDEIRSEKDLLAINDSIVDVIGYLDAFIEAINSN